MRAMTWLRAIRRARAIAGRVGAGSLAAFLLSACFDDEERVAGGSVTTNGIAGRVLQEGRAAAGALVHLYPAGHDPFRDGPPRVDTTDARGEYAFGDLGAGTYQVIARRTEGRSAARVESLRVPDGLDRVLPAPDAELLLACSLRVALPDGLAGTEAYVYLPGTGLGARVDAAAREAGTVVLAGAPAGRYDSLVLRAGADEAPRNLVAAPLALSPGETRTVSPFARWKQALRIRVAPAAWDGVPEGSLDGFPLLVRLDESTFDFAEAAPGGADLRATRDDSVTHLPVSVASWDPEARKAEVWVRLDSHRAPDGGIDLRLFAGAPADAPPSADPGAVFDTAAGFLTVWRFDSADSGAAPDLRDATGHAHHGSASAGFGPGATVSGAVGPGVDLDGVDDHADLGPSSRYLPAAGRSLTLSAWIRPDSLAPGDSIRHRLVSFKTDTVGISSLAWGLTANGTPAHYSRASDSVFAWATPLVPGVLRHLALVVEGGSFRGYLDGRLDFSADVEPLAAGGARATLFGAHLPGNRAFAGLVDELRIEGRPRGPLWVRLAYETQRPAGSPVVVTRLKGP